MYVDSVLSSRCICNLLGQTLTVFLGAVLLKRYTNPSADIISVLAGLDHVDAVFLDFANALDGVVKSGRSCRWQVMWHRLYWILLRIPIDEVRDKAVEVILSLTSGAYQTSLVSYFTHRDLFPALIKVRRTSHLVQ